MPESKKKILLIDDDFDRFKIVKDALITKHVRHAGEPIFSDQEFEILPREDEAETFCNTISESSIKDVYFKIFEFIEDNNIDVMFTDLTFNTIEKVGKSSGEHLIKNLLKNNLHEKLPIIAYSRKSDNQVELDKEIRSKIIYVPVGEATTKDVAEIRSRFSQSAGIETELLKDRAKEYKDNKNKFDLAIICALGKEHIAVKELIGIDKWRELNQHYEMAYWKNKELNIILKIVLTSMNDNMGMVEASLRTLDLINFSTPKLVAMTGIAGGSKKNGARLGDVCVAKSIDNWQSGRYEKGGRIKLSPEIRELSQEIKEFIETRYQKNEKHKKLVEEIIDDNLKVEIQKLINKEISEDNKFLKKLDSDEKEEYKKFIRQKDRFPKFQYADMMTGSSLVADEKIIDEGMIARNRKAFFFDMEAYAVARVSHTKGYDWIVIKSIVDYGDHHKGDNWHDFACFFSAKVLYRATCKFKPQQPAGLPTS